MLDIPTPMLDIPTPLPSDVLRDSITAATHNRSDNVNCFLVTISGERDDFVAGVFPNLAEATEVAKNVRANVYAFAENACRVYGRAPWNIGTAFTVSVIAVEAGRPTRTLFYAGTDGRISYVIHNDADAAPLASAADGDCDESEGRYNDDETAEIGFTVLSLATGDASANVLDPADTPTTVLCVVNQGDANCAAHASADLQGAMA